MVGVRSSVVAALALALGLGLSACARNNAGSDLAGGAYAAAGPGSVQEFTRQSATASSSTPIRPNSRRPPRRRSTSRRHGSAIQHYAFTIEGHADERGTREYNFALGARRAETCKDYLIAKGVSASRMKTISFGKERPVAVCDDISCWSQNRRAVTVLNGSPAS